jgi:hypothetical protein
MQENERLPMKVVGRRGETKVDAITFDTVQRAVNILRHGRPFVPKGVWRFKSFEEADQWTMKMLTRPRNPGSQR